MELWQTLVFVCAIAVLLFFLQRKDSSKEKNEFLKDVLPDKTTLKPSSLDLIFHEQFMKIEEVLQPRQVRDLEKPTSLELVYASPLIENKLLKAVILWPNDQGVSKVVVGDFMSNDHMRLLTALGINPSDAMVACGWKWGIPTNVQDGGGSISKEVEKRSEKHLPWIKTLVVETLQKMIEETSPS